MCTQTLSGFSDNYPVAVVYPTSTEQVQAVVRCGKAARVKVLPRCGNHANEGEHWLSMAVGLEIDGSTACYPPKCPMYSPPVHMCSVLLLISLAVLHLQLYA